MNELQIIDEMGNNKKVEVLAHIKLDNVDNDYIIYTENKQNQKGHVKVFVSEVVLNEHGVDLININEDVWNKLKRRVAEILKEG
ncbi:MAG: hypothetical protein RR847_04070 [Bacilli bacterium]